MAQAAFEYAGARDSAGIPARVSIFGGDARRRSAMGDDLAKAGFRANDGGDLAALVEGSVRPLGDVAIVDCPEVHAQDIAALARLDERIARSGTQLIVLTSMEGLDAVFSILDRSRPQILIGASRAELVVSVGRVMPRVNQGRVREMSERERISLLRLSEQVDAIAQELDRISAPEAGLGAPADLSQARADDALSLAQQAAKSRIANGERSHADAAMIRSVIAARQARGRFFDANLFADPAWDMLLDLAASDAEGARVSVTSLCIAAGVPATTALRWLKQMEQSGIFVRVADPADKRRAFIELSEGSRIAMQRYFESIDMSLAIAA